MLLTACGLESVPPTPPMTMSPDATVGVKPVTASLKVIVMVIGETLVGLAVTELTITLEPAVSTFHVKEAGVGSMFPAASMVRTWKVWLPSLKPGYDCGLVQAVNEPLSSLHWKPATPEPPLSFPVKLKLALALLVGLVG